MNAPQFTINDVISQRIKLADKVKEITERHDKAKADELAPYLEAITKMDGVLTDILLKLSPDEGRRNISTEAGTVYRNRLVRVKVEDREKFMEFVFNTGSEQFLTNHVTKEPVIEYMDEHQGLPPPGIHHEVIWQTIVRRR